MKRLSDLEYLKLSKLGAFWYKLKLFFCAIPRWLWGLVLSILGFFNRLLGGAWGALVGSLALLAASAVILIFFTDSEVYTETVVVRWFCDSPLLYFLKS